MIRDKVISILDKMRGKETIDRMERDRKIARISNIITQEIDSATEKYKKHLCTFIHHTIKDELKWVMNI